MLALSDCMTHLRMERAVSRLPSGLFLRTTERLGQVNSETAVELMNGCADPCASGRVAPTQCGACAIDPNVVMCNAGNTAAMGLRLAQNVGRCVRLRGGECFAMDRETLFRCSGRTRVARVALYVECRSAAIALHRLARRKHMYLNGGVRSRLSPRRGVTRDLAALQCPCAVSACPDRSVLSLLLCLAGVCVITHAYPKSS